MIMFIKLFLEFFCGLIISLYVSTLTDVPKVVMTLFMLIVYGHFLKIFISGNKKEKITSVLAGVLSPVLTVMIMIIEYISTHGLHHHKLWLG